MQVQVFGPIMQPKHGTRDKWWTFNRKVGFVFRVPLAQILVAIWWQRS